VASPLAYLGSSPRSSRTPRQPSSSCWRTQPRDPLRRRPGLSGPPVNDGCAGWFVHSSFNTDCPQAFTDCPENSWATGSNPAVDSVYLRLARLNPRLEGNNTNDAESGSMMADLRGQAQSAVRSKAELVLIATGTNDACGGRTGTMIACYLVYRYRLDDTILELRMRDLAFTDGEAAQLAAADPSNRPMLRTHHCVVVGFLILSAIPFAAFHSNVFLSPQKRIIPNVLHFLMLVFILALNWWVMKAS